MIGRAKRVLNNARSGALVVGSLVYGEKLNTKQMICVALIIVAVIGLKIF